MKLRSISIILLFLLWSAGMQAQQSLRLSLKRTIEMANDSSLSAFRYQNISFGILGVPYLQGKSFTKFILNLTPAQYYRNITQRYDSNADVDVYRAQQMFSAASIGWRRILTGWEVLFILIPNWIICVISVILNRHSFLQFRFG